MTSRRRSPLIGGEWGEESRKLGQKSEPKRGEEEQIPRQRSTETATVTRTGPLDANWTEPRHTATARLILDPPGDAPPQPVEPVEAVEVGRNHVERVPRVDPRRLGLLGVGKSSFRPPGAASTLDWLGATSG